MGAANCVAGGDLVAFPVHRLDGVANVGKCGMDCCDPPLEAIDAAHVFTTFLVKDEVAIVKLIDHREISLVPSLLNGAANYGFAVFHLSILLYVFYYCCFWLLTRGPFRFGRTSKRGVWFPEAPGNGAGLPLSDQGTSMRVRLVVEVAHPIEPVPVAVGAGKARRR
jgi:hypothetical protein